MPFHLFVLSSVTKGQHPNPLTATQKIKCSKGISTLKNLVCQNYTLNQEKCQNPPSINIKLTFACPVWVWMSTLKLMYWLVYSFCDNKSFIYLYIQATSREMASILISDLYGKILHQEDISKCEYFMLSLSVIHTMATLADHCSD